MATDKQKVKVERLMQYSAAITSLGDMDMLEGGVAYQLGRFGDYCNSFVKLVEKEKTRLIMKYRDEIKSENTTSERKTEIQNIINRRMDQIGDLEETVELPSFKLSDFIAKSDKKSTIKYADGGTETKEFKEGQQMVPVSFFTRMGGCIKDDKTSTKDKRVLEAKGSALEKLLLEDEKLETVASESETGDSAPVAEIKNKLNDKKSVKTESDVIAEKTP